MLSKWLPSIVWLVPLLSTACWGQGQSDLRKPLDAMLQSVAWSAILSRDHDVTITAHMGSHEDAPLTSYSLEDVCKSRQIFESKTGKFWIPYARGSFTIRFNSNNASPMDQRSVGVVVGDGSGSKETSFIGGPSRTIRGVKDVLSVSNPIDLGFVTTNPYARTFQRSEQESTNLDVVLSRLESLESSQLRVAEEMLDGRKVIVYRVKAIPTASSKFIAVNKIVVSAEGFDNGRVLQFSFSSMKLDDKAPYEKDQQLTSGHLRNHRVYWKETEVEDSNNNKETLVLPVSIANTLKSPHGADYLNVTLEWNSFATARKELLSKEAIEKVATEFDRQIDKVLNR